MNTSYLNRLNPRNSLFGQIFVWFWLAVIIMISLTFFVARYFSAAWEVNALSAEQLSRAQVLTDSLQQLAIKPDMNMDKAVKRVSARGRRLVMAFNAKTNDVILGFPPSLLNQADRFIELKDAQSPLLIRTNNSEFSGPFIITVKNQDYLIYVGRLLRREQRPVYTLTISFITFVLLGTLACLGIAWTITKPIKQLSILSKELATGKLASLSGAGVCANTHNVINRELSARKDELGNLHTDINSMAANLATSLSQQKALMANISHELRTPLTRMQLALAMLNVNDEEQQNYTNRIEKDIGIMDTLIGQSLQLAKMSDDNQVQWMQWQQLQLSSILTPLHSNLEFEANATQVVLKVKEYQDLTLALIKLSFVSAIENVTRNAIKHCNQAVEMTVLSPNLAGSASNTNSKLSQDNSLIITIEDDGEGLSESQMSQIFEPFYRAPNGQHYQGTGLGLAIAKAAVELHHGKIDVSASSLGGLKVSLYFPLTPPAHVVTRFNHEQSNGETMA